MPETSTKLLALIESIFARGQSDGQLGMIGAMLPVLKSAFTSHLKKTDGAAIAAFCRGLADAMTRVADPAVSPDDFASYLAGDTTP